MSSKREDERNEKIIRGLMKLPPNRRCINCNSLGPQYVCTNFWTFVCTTCSGIHREFTHRVKSVSMAKFTFQEVDALQQGGNQRARELFLKAWDLHRDKLPDNSNLAKVREFIKNVYVDKIYALEKSSDRPPRGPQSLRTKDDETRRASSYHSYSQSPPYDFQYEERRYGKHGPALTRKPGSDRGPYEGKLASFLSPDHSSYRANDDRFANDESHHRASDFSFSAGGDPFRLDVLSPSSLRFSDIASGPERPAEILHQKSPSLSSLPRSSVSGTFDGVDLFSAHFAPPKVTSTPPSASTFPEQQPAQNPQASSLDLFAVVSQQQSTEPSAGKTSEVVMEDNGGWATFDTPEKMVPLSTKTTAPATASSPDGHNFRKFNPFSLDQDFYQNSEGHEPSASTLSFQNESPQNVEATANNSHFWTAFEDSGEQLHIQKVESNRQAAVSDVDNSLGVGAHEVLKNGDNARTAEGTYCAPSSLSSHFSMPLNDFPIVPAVDAATPSLATESKPINPFDVRYDSDMESGNSSWDMSSLQDALSNNEMPTFCIDGENESWFAQDAVPFDPPIGSLAFISGQAPNVQIPNIHAQGPVASVGGNPFA